MNPTSLEVVRLGGSLLVPSGSAGQAVTIDLRERLAAWRRDRRGVRVWIAGTGAWGEELRRLQRTRGLSDVACHWGAISLMSASATLTAELLEADDPIREMGDLRRAIERGGSGSVDLVFDVASFLRNEEPALGGTPLPANWSVTSDSIAARVAHALDAGTLTLVKSCPGPTTRDLAEWRSAGLVDGFFPQAASPATELRWVDLSRLPAEERRYAPER